MTQMSAGLGKKFDARNANRFWLYTHSEVFRKAVGTGGYLYLDGTLCLSTPESLDMSQGKVSLSKNAREHPSRYLMSFSDTGAANPATGQSLLMPDGLINLPELFWNALLYSPLSFAISPLGIIGSMPLALTPPWKRSFSPEDMFKSYQHFNEQYHGSERTFGDTLKDFMRDRRIRVTELSSELGISERQLGRLRSGESKPSFEILLALCIGMHLEPWNSRIMLRSAWHELPADDDGKAYVFLIQCCYDCSVAQCNQFLRSIGLPPLTNKMPEKNP